MVEMSTCRLTAKGVVASTQVSKICKRQGVPFILDACRFAENAYFIKTREQGHSHRSVKSIAQVLICAQPQPLAQLLHDWTTWNLM